MSETHQSVLAIDQGTQSSRAILFDSRGNQIARASRKVGLNRIDHHHVEQDGLEILSSVKDVIAEILNGPDIDSRTVAAAGMATQRSSVIAWERNTGNPLSPVLSWQDRREHDWLKTVEKQSGEIRRLTGLRLTPHYGASKLRWLLHNNDAVEAAARQGNLVMGPLAAFLVANLTGNFRGLVDHANASRTQLWNLQTRDWDDSLLKLFGISKEWLPEVQPIRSGFGVIQGTGIPLTALNGDQTAAIYANGPIESGEILVNLGTGAFVLKPTGHRIIDHASLLSGLGDSSSDESAYLVEGTVNGAGAALKWAASNAGLNTSPEAVASALEPCPDPGLLFINSVGGLGSPWWMDGPVPHWCDSSGNRIVSPHHVQALRAVIESILYLVMKNIETILESGLTIERIRISGGLSNQGRICQQLANLSGLPVLRSNQPEATARGIAWLALGKPEDWQAGEIETFKPEIDNGLHQRYVASLALLDKFAIKQ